MDSAGARKIWAVTQQLDLSGFEQDIQALEGRAGRNTFSPQVLISISIYSYAKDWHSAREIERQMSYEPGLQWLAGLRTVNHHKLPEKSGTSLTCMEWTPEARPRNEGRVAVG